MKGLFRAGGGWVVLGLVVLVGPSWSDTKPPAPRPKTRVGLVNLSHVIRSYDKFQAYQVELKETAEPFQERDQKYRKSAEKLNEELQFSTTPPDRRTEIEKKLKTLQRQMEDNKAEATAALTKKQESQMKALFRDVQEATRRHARAQELDLVLHYNDAVGDEQQAAANIARKLNAGACLPLYAADGMDISEEIIKRLNERARREET